jgi:hypothetical protein
MAIDNPLVREFLDGDLRPYAELIRKVDLVSLAIVNRWAEVSALVPNTSEDVVTNRPTLPALTGANLHSLVAEAVNKGQTFSGSVYEKFCVRAAEVG